MLLSGFLFLNGCVDGGPRDIEFVSLHRVDAYDHPELDINSRGYRGTHQTLLMVEFYTKTNLLDYADENHVNLGSWSFFCDEGDDKADLGLTSIYRSGREVVPLYGKEIKKDAEIAGHNKTPYYMFLDPVRIETSYDLRKANDKNPSGGVSNTSVPTVNDNDICFRLKGANDSGGFKSNVVKIPAALIHRELQ